ncbi:hypothetical protein [Micromonospora sp. NPDC005324]|uniref:hypothetical protein n=1 Tax=Micromonospora sp. NPDC005324 TaxID=3157033 RepID=UPI0033BCF182
MGLALDALEIIAVVVTAVSVTDNAIGIRLREKVTERTPKVARAWVDARFKQHLALHGAMRGVDIKVVKRPDTTPGFVLTRKPWIVEQVNGTLMPHGRRAHE